MMKFTVRNLADGRVVYKHKKYDRYYVQHSDDLISDDLELYTSSTIIGAFDVYEATKERWNGINVDAWQIVLEEEDG